MKTKTMNEQKELPVTICPLSKKKTMNEQMEDLEKEIEDTKFWANPDYLEYLEIRKSQLQTDMKIVEELKEKLKSQFRDIEDYYNVDVMPFGDWCSERIDKLFKGSVGR